MNSFTNIMDDAKNLVTLQALKFEKSAYYEAYRAEYKAANVVKYKLEIVDCKPVCSFVDEDGFVFHKLYLLVDGIFQSVDTSCTYCGPRYRLGVTTKDVGGFYRNIRWDENGFYVNAWSLDGKRTYFKKYFGKCIEVDMRGCVVGSLTDWFGAEDKDIQHFESYTYTDENGNKIVKTENAANYLLTAGETESLQKLLNGLNDFCKLQNINLVMDTSNGVLRAFHGKLSFDGDEDASEFPAYMADYFDCSCMDYGCCDEAVVIK